MNVKVYYKCLSVYLNELVKFLDSSVTLGRVVAVCAMGGFV